MIWCITFCYFYVITCRFRSKYTVYFVWFVRRFTVSNSFQEKLVSESFKSVCVYECFEIRSNFIKSNKVSCVLSEWFFACRSLVTIYFRSYELNKRSDTKEIQIAQERYINCKLFYFKTNEFFFLRDKCHRNKKKSEWKQFQHTRWSMRFSKIHENLHRCVVYFDRVKVCAAYFVLSGHKVCEYIARNRVKCHQFKIRFR